MDASICKRMNSDIIPSLIHNWHVSEEAIEPPYFYDKTWKNTSQILIEGDIIKGIIRYRKKDEKTLYISDFHIFDVFRHKWFWKKMMELFIETQVDDIKYIILETNKNNKKAQIFYKKCWFRELLNKNLESTYFKKFYKQLCDETIMFYKNIIIN